MWFVRYSKLAAGCLHLAVVFADTALQRITPENIRMPLNPGGATEYSTEKHAFPGLSFDNPVAIVAAPGETNRLFIVERAGRIILIPNLQEPSKEVFLDISERVNSDYTDLENGAEGLTSVAFHPDYERNGVLFVVYTWISGNGNVNRLSRFERLANNAADPDSEFVMIDQPDAGYGHNFNDLKFGPDGYLYMAAGDEGDDRGPGDGFANSQRIDKDFFSAIMRLDVDFKPESLEPNTHPAMKGGYKIPPDNPFVEATEFNGLPVDPENVRTEFYAVGFRNPWKMSFDPETGILYTGDVGLHAREEINIVVKGGNYGWAFREGLRPSALGDPPEGVTLVPPLLEYPHGDYGAPYSGRCVIGGVVYRGRRFPDLYGAYVFGDYLGNIWLLRHSGNTVTQWQRIAGLFDVSGFGIDPRNGDVLICKDKLNGTGDGIFRLEPRIGSGNTEIPPTLAGTGLFSDLQTLTPAAGIIPYSINLPFWSDGAEKSRWFGLLDSKASIDFSRYGNWSFPAGTIWVKHFELEMVQGDPASRRPIETRVLIKNNSNDGVYGATYRWNHSRDDAELVPPEGLSETFEIERNGEIRSQTWRYPGTTECLVCHTPSGGYALGFNTAQLNRDFTYPLTRTNQVFALRDAGYVRGPTNGVHILPRFPGLDEEEWSREHRARSYLAVNCANCHNPEGVERARWDARIQTPLSQTKMIHGELLDQFGHPDNRVITPGDPERSVLLQRMKLLGQGHMPPIGNTVIDQDAVELLEQWIEEDLRGYRTFEQWVQNFGLIAKAPNDDPDQDGAVNWLEYLLDTNPSIPRDAFALGIEYSDGSATMRFPKKANRGFEIQASPNITTGWKEWDHPANAPFYLATNALRAIDLPLRNEQSSFYRVRVYEP